VLTGRHVVVATGSSARALPGVPFDEDRILGNDGALRVGAVPQRLGLDRLAASSGSRWARCGAGWAPR
jgi:dihydrolipoamide dehydrogenase